MRRQVTAVALCTLAALAACSVSAVTFTPSGEPAPDASGDAGSDDGPPPACDDGVRNGDETDVDCGGPCARCSVGGSCGAATDCATSVCTAAQCQPAACDDDAHNGDETDVDCGGSCDPCGNNRACSGGEDCASQVCAGSVCRAATCTDDLQNGQETDLNCGGPDCAPCDVGKTCAAAADCVTSVCNGAKCRDARCGDGVRDDDETDRDCGGSCGPCGDGQACVLATDCASQICSTSMCQAARCDDNIENGHETDRDCGGTDCAPCSLGQACVVDSDCTASGICDASACRLARSCAEYLQHRPAARDGTYTLAPLGAAPFGAVCDMTRDGGGWTLLLKASGDDALTYAAAAWTDGSLIAADDLTTNPGNAKYQAFLSLPVNALRGELDGFRYTKIFATRTAREIFAGPADTVTPYPLFNSGGSWSSQPHCQTFGINTPYEFARARFGWNANQEDDCTTTDTAIGLGIAYIVPGGASMQHGAGYICQAGGCVPDLGAINVGGNGLLWGR
jgi:hypothetical protein